MRKQFLLWVRGFDHDSLLGPNRTGCRVDVGTLIQRHRARRLLAVGGRRGSGLDPTTSGEQTTILVKYFLFFVVF